MRIIVNYYEIIKKEVLVGLLKTGDEGIEPPLKVLETLVIPFDQSPMNYIIHSKLHIVYT